MQALAGVSQWFRVPFTAPQLQRSPPALAISLMLARASQRASARQGQKCLPQLCAAKVQLYGGGNRVRPLPVLPPSEGL